MTRELLAVPTPADPSVVEALLPTLAAALDGTGPALRPVRPPQWGHSLSPEQPQTSPIRDGSDEEYVSDEVAVVLSTSGSSGVPKGVLLSRTALTWAADALHERVGGPGTWLLALPAWHIGGLQVLVRSIRGGTAPPLAMDLTAPFTAEAFTRATAATQERARSGKTYTSIVPTQLARILDGGDEAVAALASYDAVLVGAAATPPELAARARDQGATIVLSYGMSETSGGCAYDGRPLDGIDIRLRDSDNRILVRGPSLFDGYHQRPDLTAEALVDGWLVSNDVGRWDDGRLTVLGRADDVIVTGGENVSPLAVAEALRARPDVSDAAVVGVPDAEWGQAVVAYVVPTRPGAPIDSDAAREQVRAALGRAAVPRLFETLDALPMLASGKVDRAALAELASTSAKA
jgi:O-succinylbenzoic acid--CoA ligase